MDDAQRRSIIKATAILAPVLVIGIVLLVLRGPNISNALKQAILPEIGMMLGRKVIAQNIYLNIFPLFIEAKGLKVFDDGGERLLIAPQVKAYLDLSALFSKRLTIRRLVIKEPEVSLSRKQAEEIAGNVKRYLATTRENALKVKVLSVELQNGSAGLLDDRSGLSIAIKGFGGEAILGSSGRVIATAENIVLKKEGMPDISAGVSAALLVSDNVVEIKKLTVDSFGSRMTGTGDYGSGQGKIKADLSLMLATLKKLFKLEKSGEGSVSVQGSVSLVKEAVTLDLDVQGSLYIQTLMELLKVQEKIEGYVTLKGQVKGPLNKLVARGTGELSSGNLFNVDIDHMKCGISYADGTMRFTDGIGRLYKGSATLSASIALPVVNYYTLKVDFTQVDSGPVFKLIGWDPGVMPGRVSGTLVNSGSSFDPAGVFEYRNRETGKNALGRVREVTGRYGMKGDLVTITGLKLHTGSSDAEMSGTADLEKKMLDFEGVLHTRDLSDMTAPYFTTVHGAGEFRGKIAGLFADPVISGSVKIGKPAVGTFGADVLTADIRYKKDLLTVNSLSANGTEDAYTMDGAIRFRNAADLFDFRNPEYALSASISNADLKKFIEIFYPDFQGSGRFRTELKITGRGEQPVMAGEAVVRSGTLYGVSYDSATLGWKYQGSGVQLSPVKIQKGKSFITCSLSIDPEGRFVLSAASDKLFLSDLVNRPVRGDAVFALKAEGSGTTGKHHISITADMVEGRLRDRPVGTGTVTAEVRDRELVFRASLLNNKVIITGKGRVEKEFPWEAKVDIQAGRYDTVISAFLKEVPEDLILSMNGSMSLRGDRNQVSATSAIRQLNLSMYGYSFTNDNEIRLELRNRHLAFDHVTLRGGNALVKMNGSLDIGRSYNLAVEGSSALSPFKSLSTKIGVIKGDAEFALEITGDWEKPSINGGINVTNGALSLKDYSYRISALNGYLYLDNDRVVLEKLTGKLGGGDIDLTGSLYLKKFTVNRFFVEAAMNNISASVSSDFSINFNGNILYKGTPEEQIISGDVIINRARYRERIEWKSWLLRTKQIDKVRSEISNLEKAQLNVRVVGRDNIQVDNNIARADVTADMLLRGTVYRPALFGRLESKEGTVYFRNNEFRILHASADFADPNRLNAVIAIAAETIVKGYKIKMNLEGRMNQFAMSLSSDPVLKEMDILALLTVGQTGGQLKGLEGGVGAGEATSFVTGKLQDVVEERLRSITGLDRFQVDPHVSRITGTVEPRVTVSKRLLGDKMFITYTSSAGSSEEQIIKLEYFLNRSTSLVGIRDERGIIGGDVKFRFEFK
ncbi:MAG: translocation/assembly module TamB domain-containing protein [Thermodesulfovibrionales bacterium]